MKVSLKEAAASVFAGQIESVKTYNAFAQALNDQFASDPSFSTSLIPDSARHHAHLPTPPDVLTVYHVRQEQEVTKQTRILRLMLDEYGHLDYNLADNPGPSDSHHVPLNDNGIEILLDAIVLHVKEQNPAFVKRLLQPEPAPAAEQIP